VIAVQFVFTIDTEADDQWSHGRPLATRNVACWEALQEVCRRHGVPATYLVTSEIIRDAHAQTLLHTWTAAGEAEVGAHLHPWTTEPFGDTPGLRANDEIHAFPSQLPSDLLRAKLETLTFQIESTFGRRPRSFRAGRFGLDARAASLLTELGYVVDSSVTPQVDWRATTGMPGGTGGPDFSAHSSAPFLIAGSGEPSLLEIPVTIAVTGCLSRHSAMLRRLVSSGRVRPFLERLSGHSVPPQPVWLRPVPGADLRVLQRLWETCRQAELPVAVMILHSSELLPEGNPYWTTPQAVTHLLGLLDGFFHFLERQAIPCRTLTAAAAALAPSRGSLPTLRL